VSEKPRERWIAWGLTWVAYATYYTGRKGFSVAKKSIRDQLGVSEAALGAIDTAFLTAYALGQFASGVLGDRIGARRLVGFGMLLSAACCAAFGATRTAVLFGVAFCLNGLAQSTGWPGNTRAMAEWTTLRNRGSVMAFWATCYQVGGIAATAWAGWLLAHWGWPAAFYGPAVWIAIVGLLVLWLLKPGPAPATLHHESTDGYPSTAEPAIDLGDERRDAQRRVLKNPVLWCYGASYFFIKFIRYALLFWLPYYLSTQHGYAEDDAAYLSTAFEGGGIAGVIIIGTLSDRLRHWSRALLAAVGLVLLTVALFAYTHLGESGPAMNAALLALVGATLFGPDSLISGAAAQDAGGPHAAAMATGFVNGLGSIGAILEGLLVPEISKRLGWNALFPTLVGLALVAALALTPTLRRAPAPRAGAPA
jgi:sugar phosphate permease